MSTTAVPWAASSATIRNSAGRSSRVSTAVGSSRMRMRGRRANTFRISTRCCWPTVRLSTLASKSTSMPSVSATGCKASRKALNLRCPRPQRASPKARFSATLRAPTSLKCWCTMPMPACAASRGEPNLMSRPDSRISPSSGCIRPAIMFISVDLPAPFSPSTPRTSPGATSKLILSLASKAPKRLLTATTSSNEACAIATVSMPLCFTEWREDPEWCPCVCLP